MRFNKQFYCLAATVFITACSSLGDNSDLDIAHGYDASGNFPAVVQLMTADRRGGCTGTFVGTNTVLTAAHCAQSEAVYYNGNRPSQVYTNPGYSALDTGANDTAIVVYASDLAPAVMPIATRSIAKTDSYIMIGYGANIGAYYSNGTPMMNSGGQPMNKGSGTKRYAPSNRFKNIGESVIETFGDLPVDSQPGTKLPTTMVGDSGGPLLFGNTVGGTVSWGQSEQASDGKVYDVTYYSNINSATNRSFLQTAQSQYGAKITFAEPSDKPMDGSTPADVGSVAKAIHFLLSAFNGNAYLIKVGVEKSLNSQKMILCFSDEASCRQDMASATRKLFYAPMTAEQGGANHAIFASAEMNLSQNDYTITALALDSSNNLVKTRSINLTR